MIGAIELETRRRKPMTKNFEAIYEDGVFKPVNPVDFAEKQRVTFYHHERCTGFRRRTKWRSAPVCEP
jgi:predicted DNA-binding antitoxin AbrB/MazE fold protein